MGYMIRNLLILWLVVAIFLSFIPVVHAAPDIPGPINVPTTGPTTEPTQEPTEIPTTIPTKEPTAIPTTIPTMAPTTIPPTKEPTTFPVTAPTTEPTITIAPQPIGGGKGWIDTYGNVDGATVSFDGSVQGTIAGGMLSVGVSPSGTPVRTITVSKGGYTSWSGSLSHMPADQEHVAVYATINPLPTPPTPPVPPQNGAIYAQSSPGGAAIYLNGVFYGYAPLTTPNLQPNSYSMKATLSGYSSNSQIITVYAGQTATYYPQLQPSPPAPHPTGTVYVTSNPNAAQVSVDGNYQGKAPLTVTLYPGNHNFRLSLSNYNDYTATVYVNGGTAQNLNAIMTTAVYGTVFITSMPGASVFMDSNAQGGIPSSGSLTLNNIANGNHLFRVTAPGYNDWINTIYVKANVVNPVTATLTMPGPNPTPVPLTGGLDIVSTPPGAEVFVDNQFRGYTPAMITGIPAGQHQILLRYTGYVDYSTTVTIIAGQTIPGAFSMQPAPTPTPASSPSVLVPVAGLMVLIATVGIFRRRI